ncbi:MAG: 4-hydroxy-tetrahydrodipicolinate synthase [Flavobacteriaceae bacterium]|nr:4-hydroxy-tetrahydrodipicolinate synthase [Flavobacteriaceae bacterium]MDZ4148072.1 4-hydroxy-tetrahydrodipicolinate synthase [Flavobacteriaceae bacterium]
MTSKFKGIGVALVTPFSNDGQVDYVALDKLVQLNIKNEIDYLVVLGTTAETSTLTTVEKKKVIQTVIESNQSRVPLVLGLGGNNTTELIEQMKAPEVLLFDAILSVSPYYNKPTQDGIYAHYKALSSASPVPIILYNVPGRTGSNVLPQTVLRLARDCKNIIGIKEASGDVVQGMRILREKPTDFLVISGDDMTALPLILAGGSGVISVIGQGIPSVFSKLIHAGLSGDLATANQLQHQCMPIIDLIFQEGNPAGIKSLLAHLGIGTPTVRLPLVAASDSLSMRITSSLETNMTVKV